MPFPSPTKEEHAKRDMTKIKDKEKILKAMKETQHITHKEMPTWLSAYFSAANLQDRREWPDTFEVMKGKNLPLKTFYLARLSFKFKEKIKSFIEKQKLREFSTTKQALQQMLKELL